jgi:hypothetical protein
MESRSKLVLLASTQILYVNLKTSNDEGVFCTVPGNQSLITCVKFIKDEFLITTNEGGVLSLWAKTRQSHVRQGIVLLFSRINRILSYSGLIPFLFKPI